MSVSHTANQIAALHNNKLTMQLVAYVKVVHKTARALLLRFPNDIEVWLPQKFVTLDTNTRKAHIPLWLVKRHGLEDSIQIPSLADLRHIVAPPV